MKKFFLITCASVTLITAQNIKARSYEVSPTVGQSHWAIIKNVGTVSDEWTPVPIEDPSGQLYIIDEPGNYQLVEDSTGQILIDTSDVWLNLNGYKLEHDNTDENIIEITESKTNIKIENGKLSNASGPGTGSGIFVQQGCTFVQIENMQIFDCGYAIRLDGQQDSEIKSCRIIGCDFISNTTGVSLYKSNNNVLSDCRSLNGLQTSYELLHSKVNCVTNCKSINTTSGGTNNSATAFMSDSGSSNMFKDCAAKKTSTDAWEFCNKSYGFLLTGTEKKTKIINCVVNETEMTSTVSAVAYGIQLLPTILEVGSQEEGELLHLINEFDTLSPADISPVAWSPNERYIVIGDDQGSLKVFNFNGSELDYITSYDLTGSDINSAEWSPNGKYIVTTDAEETTYFGTDLRVFGFDGARLTHIDNYHVGITGNVLNSAVWSPCGKYIATGDVEGYLRIFSFDGLTLTHIDANSTPGSIVISVSWSPCGKYIASGDQGNNIRVFSFDGSTLTHIDNESIGTTTNSTAWSPCGKYIAAMNWILEFNGNELNKKVYHANLSIFSTWSPCGKYVTCIYGAGCLVFRFNGSNLTKLESSPFANNTKSVDWSPSGRYIASGSNDGYIRVYSAMHGPESCLITGNSICDTFSYGQFVGTGISACVGNNGIIGNVSSGNEVGFSFGIPNVYDMLSTRSVNLTDNLLCNCGCV